MKQTRTTPQTAPVTLPRSWLLTLYVLLLRLYPSAHQATFATEMQAVFTEALTEATADSWRAQLVLCGRELRDLPRLLLHEHWHATRQSFALRLHEEDPMRSDLPGVVPVGYGSLPHLFFVVTGRNPRLRRAFDIVLALVGVLLVSPLLLLLPILIKLDTYGPVFYRQQRLGKNGQPYVMYKFRSMLPASVHQTSAATASQSATAPPITRIGHLTRRWHLDEIPQVFNVLKGDMSIFGPRPPLPK
ncbi:MAG: sugar transferase [Caldilineaceae bacterium]|nr:sugar transferase [Caldilineaceae bacterium]